MALQDLKDLLRRHRFRFGSEVELQDGIAAVLTKAGLSFKREAVVVGGVIDFLVGSVGVEVKVDGSTAKLIRQVYAYAEDEKVGSILIVTVRARHGGAVCEARGKRVDVLYLTESCL